MPTSTPSSIEPQPMSLIFAKYSSASSSMWLVSDSTKKEPPRGSITFATPVPPQLDVRESVRERERELLRGRRAGLADVVPGDADGVPLRHLARAELDEVADQPQVRPGREDPLLLRDVLLEDVGLQGSV